MRNLKSSTGIRLERWVWGCNDDEEFVRRFNTANRRWKIPVELQYDDASRMFLVGSADQRVAIARRSRLKYYFKGIAKREHQLVREYFLDDVEFSRGDVVIDVGANVGEVSRLLARRHSVIPLSFEPSLPEFRALEINTAGLGGRAWNEVLWSTDEVVEFHDANDSGDSSVFAPPNAKGSELRLATTLDRALAGSGFEAGTIKLLKLEAEGAEPEILEGASQTLERVEHLVADVGPERGIDRESTLIPVYELLRSRGFTAKKVAFKRPVMLFVR